ncbi:MAG TPA: translocation/assembly module TamB domain-containing protein [Gemmatimonadaceae bacterium]|nr:translocation/assembly module TamB domain-containing protein [Gemmatimonadaceae bacterium]
MRRVLAILLATLLGLVALGAIVVTVVTNTDWGRERVRRFAVKTLNGVAHGVVRIGRVEGNLLGGVTLRDLSITDSAGNPFVSAQAVSARYALRDFLRKRIYLRDVRLVRPVIVLDRPPEGQWNWKRIFPSDTTAPKDTTLGFGDWIALRNAELIEGHLVVRTPWEPADSLRGAARDSAIAVALDAASRKRVERVPAGFQQIMEFRRITGRFPTILLADPKIDEMRVDVATARLIAEPFRPPVADIRDVSGMMRVAKDSIYWRDLRAALPASRLTGLSGSYVLEDTLGHDAGDMRVAVRGAPVALADLRFLYPRLPSEGNGSLDFAMVVRGDSTDFVARDATLRTGQASLAGDFGLAMADSIRFHDTNLRFSGIDTRLIEQLVPNLKLPRRGTLGGRAALAGTTAALRVDADVAFDDTRAGTSRVAAVGEVGLADGFRARALRLRAYPVQVELARIALPTFPLAGTLTGTATLDGSSERWLVGNADLVHRDRGAYSHLVGRAEMALGARRYLDADLRARPLSLVTVGRFVPALGLRGAAAGTIRARGPFSALAIAGDLRFPDGGALEAQGLVDIASREVGYDLLARMRLFDANAVVAKAPRTSLTALARATGRGFDPATMHATLAADLTRSAFDSVAFDSLHARLAIAGGMATIDSLSLRSPFARAAVNGTFGTAPGREGALTYLVQIDSLAAVRRWLPGAADTGFVRPRPGRAAELLRAARADSARLARATEVERAALGTPAPALKVDSVPGIRRDSVAGSLHAAGVVRGGLQRFSVRGRAAALGVVARGSAVRAAAMEYALVDGGTPRMSIAAGASLDSIEAAGFALDSADLRVAYAKPNGSVQLVVVQNESQEYATSADFTLHLDHSELHLRDMRLRFDTTVWASTRPGAIRWGKPGMEVRDIELRNGAGGRIYADGRIPSTGPIALDVGISGFQIGDLVRLLQSDIEATGLFTVSAHLGGTREAPQLRAAAAVVGASYRGTGLPDTRVTAVYAGSPLLVAHADLLGASGLRLATAQARLPVNLALAGYTGPRFLESALELDVTADSLPLDALPKFTDVVSDIRGRVIGHVAVRGTKSHPSVAGALALDLGHARLVPTGVDYEDITGTMRLLGDTVVIDSLTARAGEGRLALKGALDIAKLTEPGFDLTLDADDALMLDNDMGRVIADAGVDMRGPFDSVSVQGGARVRQGVIYVPESDKATTLGPGDPGVFNVIDTSVVANRELIPTQSPLMKNLRLDGRVRIDRGTFVRNSDGNVEVFTPEESEGLHVTVDRRIDAITVDGSLATERGEYTVAGRRFTISRGTVMFLGNPELNPLIQLIGEREIQIPGREALIIRVVVGGTLRRPRIALESNAQPPMSQSDILSYLAFGRSSSSLLQFQGSSLSGQGTSSGQLVGDVAALASRQLAGIALGTALKELQTEGARSTGLDVLNITPADIPPEIFSGSAIGQVFTGTQIEAGKYLNTRTFLSVQLTPDFRSAPGIRLVHRMPKGLRIESSIEPRYQPQRPSLTDLGRPTATSVFGAFLVLERRF